MKILVKEKNIRLSWLTRVKNSEFATNALVIYNLMEEQLKAEKYLPTKAFKTIRNLIDKISTMGPAQCPHELTRMIHNLHAERKRQLTVIRQQIKAIQKASSGGFSKEKTEAANMLSKWMLDIYGVRHYDTGIGMLTYRMQNMFEAIDDNNSYANCFSVCGLQTALEELRKTNNTLIDYHHQRDIDMGLQAQQPTFAELRDEIYQHLKDLVRISKDLLRISKHKQRLLELNHMLYNYINPKRANYLQQCTKRRLRRERAKQEEEDMSIGMMQRMAMHLK